MPRVVGVRFKQAGKIYYFDPGNFNLSKDDGVIVETARGIEYGWLVSGPKEVHEEEVIFPLKQVLREASAGDEQKVIENKRQEDEAFQICLDKIDAHGLPMKLVDVEKTFDGNKVIFYFTADGRVDFRELVKDLAAVFRTRIELRQIGVRDEAKMMGGLGCCGRELCCCSWLSDFASVSIRMAKDQNLSLNPAKISGICGRLMCCLKFESEVYEQAKEQYPSPGCNVVTPDGAGRVTGINIFKQSVNVELRESKVVKEYRCDELVIKVVKPDRETADRAAGRAADQAAHEAASQNNGGHGNKGQRLDE